MARLARFRLRWVLFWALGLAVFGLLAMQPPGRVPAATVVRPAEAQASDLERHAIQRRYREDQLLIQRLLRNWPAGRPRAAIFVLARNDDAEELVRSLQELEASFNGKESARYPYVIVNDEDFTPEFVREVESRLTARCFFGRVPAQHWSYPPHVNASVAAAARAAQVRAGVLHGELESYHFMCRYFSGFFMHHPLLAGFDYYWRVEPGVKFYCRLGADPFVTMRDRGAVYGWTIVRAELMNTVPSLWPSVVRFLHEHPALLHPGNSLRALAPTFRGLSDRGPESTVAAAPYTGCHYWDNFEIGALAFFRSKPYQALFSALDATGGFFLERWGDAPVHSMAVAALTNGSHAIHRFEDIGYRHDDALHCPQGKDLARQCTCLPAADFNQHNRYCITLQRLAGLTVS